VETSTRPARTPAQLRADLARLRARIAVAAADVGTLVIASGTPVVPAPDRVDVTGNSRYLRMAEEFGVVVDELAGGVCGCHVHVGVADREAAIRLANHMRPWLPVLQALAANSPFRAGQDSGYASWRAMRWAQWPGVGPPPMLADAAAYEKLVNALVGSGALLDRAMIYWYARPSEHCPTLEIRVADVNAELDTVVLLATLVRGLAGTLLGWIDAGAPAPEIPDPLLRAAHWKAARDGLEGCGVDPSTGRSRPAAELVDLLVARAAPGLRAAGDLEMVGDLLGRLHAGGGGAARQRAAYRRRGDLHDVVDAVTVR
jgi:carboxylate-amine ligase